MKPWRLSFNKIKKNIFFVEKPQALMKYPVAGRGTIYRFTYYMMKPWKLRRVRAEMAYRFL